MTIQVKSKYSIQLTDLKSPDLQRPNPKIYLNIRLSSQIDPESRQSLRSVCWAPETYWKTRNYSHENENENDKNWFIRPETDGITYVLSSLSTAIAKWRGLSSEQM